MPKKALSTQSIVNAFPDWADIRMNEQSLGYQFVNHGIGNNLDYLLKQLQKIKANYYLPTADISDIDVYYRFDLPDSYVFTKEDNDDTELLFTLPTVSGLLNNVLYPVSGVDKNNIENFWYNATPNRISLGTTASGGFLVASGFMFQSPLRSLLTTQEIDVPGRLMVTVSGGILYFGEDNNGYTYRTVVRIEGEDRAGGLIKEELYPVYDEVLMTQHEYKSVSGVYGYGSNDIHIKVHSASFNQPDLPAVYPGIKETDFAEDMPMFWAVGSGNAQASGHLLQIKKYDADDIQFRLNGYSGKHAFMEYELLTTAGDAPVLANDVSPEPFSDNVWVVDSGTLYVYDADMYYPSTDMFEKRTYDAAATLIMDCPWLTLGHSVQIDYFWRRPTQGMTAHRVWVEKPDGTKKSIENGSEVTYYTDATSWVVGQPRFRKLRPTDVFTLDQRGDYIYSLETTYVDGTRSLDQKIVSVLSKTAKAQFGLASIIGTHNQIIGLHIDSEYKIWVLDSAGKKYEVIPHYDNMLVDFSKKRIYLRENYDQVRVY